MGALTGSVHYYVYDQPTQSKDNGDPREVSLQDTACSQTHSWIETLLCCWSKLAYFTPFLAIGKTNWGYSDKLELQLASS